MSTPDSQPLTAPALGEGGFEPYLRGVRRHPIVVILVALAAVAGAGAWMLLKTKTYTATAQIVITPIPFDDATYTGLQVVRDTSSDPPRAAQTAAQLLDAPSAASLAAQALGRPWTSAAVHSAVTVTPIGGTNVLAVQASSDSASAAASVANAYTVATLHQRRLTLAAQAARLLGKVKSLPKPWPIKEIDALLPVSSGFDPSFSLLRKASAPGSPAGPPAWRTLSLVLFAGLILGVGAALLIDAVVPRYRRTAEVTALPIQAVRDRRDMPGR